MLQAFGQVADVLDALQHNVALLDAQRRALDAAQASLELTQQSYQVGQASLLQLLDVQRLYHQARLGHVRAKAQRFTEVRNMPFTPMGDTRILAPTSGATPRNPP